MTALTGYVDDQGIPVLDFSAQPSAVVVPPAPTTPAVRSPQELGYVAPPTPADMTTFLGYPLDAEQAASAQAHLGRALALVRAYTRSRGFWGTELMAAPLAQVALSLAGRSLANPTGDARVSAGNFTASPGQPEFTLNEMLIMNEYRRRAA